MTSRSEPQPLPSPAFAQEGQEIRRLRLSIQLLSQVVSGATLDEVLDSLYGAFRGSIPYDHIGFALIDERRKVVRCRWSRSESPATVMPTGFSLLLSATTLGRVAQERRPRVINDLSRYLAGRPDSVSTRMLVGEGMASSLTCPLVVNMRSIGFIFFSCMRKDSYGEEHIHLIEIISGILAAAVEKSVLMERNAALLERQERILAMVSHDLKVPLTVIKGFASFIHAEPLEDLEPGLVQRAMSTINRASAQMDDIIGDLLDSSGLDYGSLELAKKPVDLREFLGERHTFHALAAAEKNILLEKRLPRELPDVLADPSRLKQIVDNLLSNSIKYSRPASVIRIGAVALPAGALVIFSDRGPGISQADLERIFGEFIRGRAEKVDDRRSVGLGLYIAKSLLAAHGIDLRVRSRVGRGSAFAFLLPYA